MSLGRATAYLILILLPSLLSAKQQEKAFVSDRHIILVRASHETIFGSYYFAIKNPSKETHEVNVELPIPQGATRVSPGDGLKEEDLSFGKRKIKVKRY